MNLSPLSLSFFSLLLFLSPTLSLSSCQCTPTTATAGDSNRSLTLKSIAVAAILAAGAAGVLLPVLGRSVPLLRPENDLFFSVKSFAAGVILATAFVHILPDAFARLASPCLPEAPWSSFPFAGFVAMSSAMGTLAVDSLATGYYRRSHFRKARPFDGDPVAGEIEGVHAGHVHVHTHASHGHAHGPADGGLSPAELSVTEKIRHRVVSQVLELGIVVHSVIIGVSLGTSESSKTIKPLVAALSFHQFFEGIGLGGCIVQAKFRARSMIIMAMFFSLTAPFGIALGIAISSVYSSNSSTALITEGIFDAASSGILIYMSLVDLLAADFTNPRMQNNVKLQITAHLALLMGSGFMSLLAIWA